MRLLRLIAAGLLAAAALGAEGRIGLPPPRHRIGRDVLVIWVGTGEKERITRPGSSEFRFRCSHNPERAAAVEVEVTRAPRSDGGAATLYRKSTPDEVKKLAAEGSRAQVRFAAVFRSVRLAPRRGNVLVGLPDGQRVPVRYGFRTGSGILCLVPPEGVDLDLVRSAVEGDTLHVRGQVFGLPTLGPTVVVDRVDFQAPETSNREPAWTVRVTWQGRHVVVASEPGEYAADVACRHREGARERILVRLREFRVVDLEVEGQELTAELPETREEFRRGLQDRDGLPEDHGMLFFFPRAQKPRFVMKTVSFPLSLAFIRADGVISAIARMDPGDSRGVRSPDYVNYVLEMEQGWFEQHHVEPGDRMLIP